MATNKRKQIGALRLGPAVKTVLLCLLMGGSGVGYVLQKNKLHDLGQQMKERENRVERLEWENKQLATRLADLQLPQRLDQRVREFNLGLVPPRPDQIIWLSEPRVAGVKRRPEDQSLLARDDRER